MQMNGTETVTGQPGWQTLIENITKTTSGIATAAANIRTQEAIRKLNIQRAMQGQSPVDAQVYRNMPTYATPGSQVIGGLFTPRNLMLLGGAAVLFMFLRRRR